MSFDFPSSPTTGQQFSPTAGVSYVYNGYAWDLVSGPPGAVLVPNIKTITASGTYTPSPGLVAAIVELVGGGGRGGGVASSDTAHFVCAGGGGSGGYSRRLLTAAQIGASQTVTIGAGGVAGTPNGGATSFGALCIANGGGLGGDVGVAVQPGAGLGASITGAVGDITLPGNAGGFGMFSNSASVDANLGFGGSSYFGGAVVQAWTGAAANALANTGAGGAGFASNTSTTSGGGNGGSGVCIVTEFIQQGGAAAAALPGAKVLIQTQTVSSAAAQVDFTSGIDATYDEYELRILGIQTSVAGNISLRISQDGGATWKSGASDYVTAQHYTNATPTDTGTGQASSVILLGPPNQAQPTSASAASNIVVTFAFPASTTLRKVFTADASIIDGTGYARAINGGSYSINTAAINGIRILNLAGGNLVAGTFNLYGIKK